MNAGKTLARPPRMHWARSLRFRLLAATLAGLLLAMVLSGLVLSSLFREHVQQQFEVTLTQQLDQLTARLDFDPQGQPVVAANLLSDPRWQKPYSGLYWQLDEMAAGGKSRLWPRWCTVMDLICRIGLADKSFRRATLMPPSKPKNGRPSSVW